MAVTPDGTRAYVTHLNSDTVSVIDTAKNTVVTTVQVDDQPTEVAVTLDGTRAYVTNHLSSTCPATSATTTPVTSEPCARGGI